MQFMAAILFVLSAVYAVYAVYAISSLDTDPPLDDAPVLFLLFKFLRPYAHSGATSHTASSTTHVHTTAAHTATRRRGPPAASGMVIRVQQICFRCLGVS